jgi:hypothetical protein
VLGLGVRVMERIFSFEAKTFCLSAKVGCPNLRLEERRKRFRGVYLRKHSVLVVVGGYGGSGDLVSGKGGIRQIFPLGK